MGNQGKRSVGIDLSTEAGRPSLDEPLAGADVLITSFMGDTRSTLLGLQPDDVLERHPHLVYGARTGLRPTRPTPSRAATT